MGTAIGVLWVIEPSGSILLALGSVTPLFLSNRTPGAVPVGTAAGTPCKAYPDARLGGKPVGGPLKGTGSARGTSPSGSASGTPFAPGRLSFNSIGGHLYTTGIASAFTGVTIGGGVSGGLLYGAATVVSVLNTENGAFLDSSSALSSSFPEVEVTFLLAGGIKDGTLGAALSRFPHRFGCGHRVFPRDERTFMKYFGSILS
jgi:hypothetical protein